MRRVLEIIKAVAIWLFAYIAFYAGLAIFVFAGISYASGEQRNPGRHQLGTGCLTSPDAKLPN